MSDETLETCPECGREVPALDECDDCGTVMCSYCLDDHDCEADDD